MLTENALKTRLQQLKQADYALPPAQELPQILEAMLEYVGVPDAELRDDLIYASVIRWIMRGSLTAEQLTKQWTSALDEHHLLLGLGEKETDTVFTRSFSVLLLAALIYAHRHHPYLNSEQIQFTKRRVLHYIAQERDFRGYVLGKGWAHAAAHTADLLDELAQCQELGKHDLLELLDGIQKLALQADFVYMYDEDERLSVPLVAIVQRDLLDLTQWSAWLEVFPREVSADQPLLPGFQRRINVKRFLRCVYFRIHKQAIPDQPLPETATALLSLVEKTVFQVTRF